MRYKWKAGIIVALIFVLGYLAGMGTLVSMFYFKARSFSYMGRPTRIVNKLTKTLNLNQEQKSSIETIVKQARSDLLDLRDETKPKIKRRLEQAKKEISALLNKEQRIEFDQFVEKRLARLRKMREKMSKWRESN